MDIWITAAVMLIAAGLGVIIGIPVLERYRIFCKGAAVDAIVHSSTEKNGRIYLTWAYTTGGREYFYQAKRGRHNEERKEGSRGAVLVKKGNPGKVYELHAPDDMAAVYVAGGLLLAAAMGIIMTWLFMHGMAGSMILL